MLSVEMPGFGHTQVPAQEQVKHRKVYSRR